MNSQQVPIWLVISLFGLSHTSETIISIALPILAKSLLVSDNLVQLSSSIYFFCFACGIIFWGRASDIFGRRPIMLIGLSIYITATLGCSQTTSIEYFFITRAVQAFGASVASVVCQAMTRDSYQGDDLSNAFASISIGMSLVPSIGPIIGGYLVEYLGWQYNFLFLCSVASTIFCICIIKLPETHNINLKNNNKYFNILKQILSDKKVLFFAMTIGCFNGMMFGFYTVAPFIFIKTLNINPSDFGRFGFILSFSIILGGYINRQLIKKYTDAHRIILVGMRLSLIGCSLFLIFGLVKIEQLSNVYFAAAAIALCMIIQLIGHALVVPTSLRLALEDYNTATGTAGSVFGGIYYTIVAITSLLISRIHATYILPITILYFTLSLGCFLTFTVYFRKLRINQPSHDI